MNPSNIKIIALDLDGTLTYGQNSVSEKVLKTLHSIQHAGIKLVLASARPTYGTECIAKKLKLPEFGGYIISYNGAKIVSCKDGNVLSRHTLSLEDTRKILDLSKHLDLNLLTYSHKNILSEKEDSFVNDESERNNKMPVKIVSSLRDEISQAPFKLTLYGTPEKISQVRAKLIEICGDTIHLYGENVDSLDIVAPNVDKGYALSFLLKDLGFRNENLIAVGDSINDVPMIQMAALGVAMANAPEKVKQCADYVTKSNLEEGIDHLIRKFFFMNNNTGKELDLDYFNNMLNNTLMSSLGIHFTHVENGCVEGTMPVDYRTRQPLGILHGGASLAFAETLAGVGSMFLCDETEIQVGMQVSGNHVSSALEGENVKGIGTIIHKGKSTHVWNIDVVSQYGNIISTIRVVNSILKKR